jgi:mannose-6-phosphate isomerase-like protein (cupin superfamily)
MNRVAANLRARHSSSSEEITMIRILEGENGVTHMHYRVRR